MANEKIDHPSHYGANTGIEAINVIEAWELDFHLGNVVKYISRSGKKSSETEIEDLKKAEWYLKRKIFLLEKEQQKNNTTQTENTGVKSE